MESLLAGLALGLVGAAAFAVVGLVIALFIVSMRSDFVPKGSEQDHSSPNELPLNQ